jgi:hypothetical protein
MGTLLLLGGAVAALAVMWVWLNRAWRRDTWFESMAFIDSSPGSAAPDARIWLSERLQSGGGYRVPQLSLLSLREGARHVLYTGRAHERLVLIGDHGPYVWWWSSRLGLHARDRSTGALAHGEAALLERMPELRGKLIDRATADACECYALDARGHGVRVRANDAGVWIINAQLRAEQSPDAWAEVRYGGANDDRESLVASGALTDGRDIALSGKDVRQLRLAKLPIGGAFLEGQLVWDRDRGRVLELSDPPGVLVAHRDKLGAGANRLVSRVALDGTSAWTRSEAALGIPRSRHGDRAVISFAALRPEGVYVVFNRSPYVVVLLDAATGEGAAPA